MTPHHRNTLLEANYALSQLVWSYRSELDRHPSNRFSAEDICLSDFASRTVALVQNLLAGETEKRAKYQFRPPTPESERRLADAIRARRESRLGKAGATASPNAPVSEPTPSARASAHESEGIRAPHSDEPDPLCVFEDQDESPAFVDDPIAPSPLARRKFR